MDGWMEAVENIALVIWKFQGKRKGPKKLSLHRPPPMANDLKWRFNVLRKKWNKDFCPLSKEERERPACKDKIKEWTQEMVKGKGAKAKVERGAMRVKTINSWKKMRKEAWSHGWWEQLKTRSQGRHTPLVSKELWMTSTRTWGREQGP